MLFPAAGQRRGRGRRRWPAGRRARSAAIAILHATAGSGHKRAAQALAAALSGLQPARHGARGGHAGVRLAPLSRHLRRLVQRHGGARAGAVGRALPLVAQARASIAAPRPVRLAMDRLNLRRLVRVVERESPDAVVCTHFLPVEALSPIRGRGRLRRAALLRDHRLHRASVLGVPARGPLLRRQRPRWRRAGRPRRAARAHRGHRHPGGSRASRRTIGRAAARTRLRRSIPTGRWCW